MCQSAGQITFVANCSVSTHKPCILVAAVGNHFDHGAVRVLAGIQLMSMNS